MSEDFEPVERSMLELLGDEGCRSILDALLGAEEPLSVSELASLIEVPESTLYRKLDGLTDTPLVDARSSVTTGGHPRTRYQSGVGSLEIRFHDTISVALESTDGATIDVDDGVSTNVSERDR